MIALKNIFLHFKTLPQAIVSVWIIPNYTIPWNIMLKYFCEKFDNERKTEKQSLSINLTRNYKIW